jgi:hypothetical protein
MTDHALKPLYAPTITPDMIKNGAVAAARKQGHRDPYKVVQFVDGESIEVWEAYKDLARSVLESVITTKDWTQPR